MLKRIYALISLILLTSVILSGIIAFKVIEEFNGNSNETKLKSAANLISVELQEHKSYEEITKLISTTFNSDNATLRFTIIETSGKVIYDNEVNASTMENHLYRAEVKAAIQTKSFAHAIRNSTTQNIKIYYYALYSKSNDLVIRTAMPMVDYLKSLNEIWIQFVIIVTFAFIALVIIGAFITNVVAKPLIDLKKAAIAMSDGDYSRRVARRFGDKTEISEVSNAFNKMAQQLQSVVYELAEKNSRLDTILNTMENPILAVDSSLSVTFMNKFTREEFVGDSFPESGIFPLISIVRNSEIERLVQRAAASQKAANAQISLVTRKGSKTFRVMAVPMSKENGQILDSNQNELFSNNNQNQTMLSGNVRDMEHSEFVRDLGLIVTFQDITQIIKLQQMRSDFVANVTHELKTPLTSIRGFVDTLRQGAIKNPDVSERFLEIIDVEAERLHKLISDILSLSEIEDLKEESEVSIFDLNSLMDEVIVLLDDEAVIKHVSLITAGDEEFKEPFLVKANRYRIKQILINLIENAIKYNIDHGKVYITASRNENGEVVLRVRDTGNGIPKEHLNRIFERFYRVDKGRSKELGGTGLGLSIVKHIAMLYGGNASASSTLGQGSEFTVNLKI